MGSRAPAKRSSSCRARAGSSHSSRNQLPTATSAWPEIDGQVQASRAPTTRAGAPRSNRGSSSDASNRPSLLLALVASARLCCRRPPTSRRGRAGSACSRPSITTPIAASTWSGGNRTIRGARDPALAAPIAGGGRRARTAQRVARDDHRLADRLSDDASRLRTPAPRVHLHGASGAGVGTEAGVWFRGQV